MTITPPASILVVDDTETNIDILVELLGEEYDVAVAMDGRAALSCVQEHRPDLILLDVMMPDIDGYDVCRDLKSHDDTRDIPIIFITAMDQDSDEALGLALGAVDYITKPFNPGLVKARVRNQLALHQAMLTVEAQRNELQANYDRLKEMEQLRDDLVHMMVHDLRSPLTSISGYLQMLSMIGELNEKQQRYVANSNQSCTELVNMISSLLDVSKMENNELELKLAPTQLKEVAEDAAKALEGLAAQAAVQLDVSNTSGTATFDANLVSRVLQNLLSNAIKHSPTGGAVIVTTDLTDDSLTVSIKDQGPGIPPEYHARIFEKFGQVQARQEGQKHSTGLGLTFCKLAVEAHGGTIGVNSEVDSGSTFWFKLPVEGSVL